MTIGQPWKSIAPRQKWGAAEEAMAEIAMERLAERRAELDLAECVGLHDQIYAMASRYNDLIHRFKKSQYGFRAPGMEPISLPLFIV